MRRSETDCMYRVNQPKAMTAVKGVRQLAVPKNRFLIALIKNIQERFEFGFNMGGSGEYLC